MSFVRAIFVALITLSVAALPVASGMARAAMTHQRFHRRAKDRVLPSPSAMREEDERLRLRGGMRAKVFQPYRNHCFGRGFQAQCGSCGQAGAAKLGAELQPDCATVYLLLGSDPLQI